MPTEDDPYGWRYSLSVPAQLSAPAHSYPEDTPEQEHSKNLAEEHYEKVLVLGEGGMGRVWLGWDRRLRRNVAIKEPLGERSTAGLLREARITARLEHAGVVAIHDMYEDNGRVQFVMALVRGKTLSECLAETPSSNELRTHYLRNVLQVAEAIAHAHRRGIIHRDLTPNNVIIDESDVARVIDWGLAAELGQSDTIRGGGTTDFVSPEQRSNGPLDVRSDVWSIGALIHLVLYREPPGKAIARTAAPPELVAVAKRCLSTCPTKRYENAGEVALDLRNWFEGRRVAAFDEGLAHALLRLSRLHRTAIAGIALAVLLIGAALGLGFWSTQQEASRALRAERQANLRSADLLVKDARRAFEGGDLWLARESISQAVKLAPSPDARGLSMRIHMAAFPSLQSQEALSDCSIWLVESFVGPRVCVEAHERIEGWEHGTKQWQRGLDAYEVRIVQDEVHVLSMSRELTVLSRTTGETLRTDRTRGVFAARFGATRIDVPGRNDLHSVDLKERCIDAISVAYRDFYMCIDGTFWQRANEEEQRAERMIASGLALAETDQMGRLWQGSSHGEVKLAGTRDRPLSLGESLADMRIIPNTPYLLVRGQLGSLRILDTRQGRWAASFPGHSSQAFVAEDGSIGRVRNTTLERWEFSSSAPSWLYRANSGISQVVWSTDSATLAASDGAGDVHVFEPMTGTHHPPVSVGERVAKSVTTQNEAAGFLAITMDHEGLVEFQEEDNRYAMSAPPSPLGQSRRVAIMNSASPASPVVLVSYRSGIRVVDKNGHVRHLLREHDIHDIELHPDRRSALLLGEKSLWTWSPVHPPKRLDWPEIPERAAIARDGRVALTTGPTLVIRNVAGMREHTWVLPSAALTVAWQPDGEIIATGHLDGEVNLWLSSTGKLIARTHHHGARISDAAFSPNGRMLAIASWDASISVLNVAEP